MISQLPSSFGGFHSSEALKPQTSVIWTSVGGPGLSVWDRKLSENPPKCVTADWWDAGSASASAGRPAETDVSASRWDKD